MLLSTLAVSLRWRRPRRRRSSSALSIPFYYCCLQALLSTGKGCTSFRMMANPPNNGATTKKTTTIPSSPPNSVRRTRVVRSEGGGGAGSGQKTTKKRRKITTTTEHDTHTLSTALFDDDFASSLESALFFRRRDPTPSSKELVEEIDSKFAIVAMEDHSVTPGTTSSSSSSSVMMRNDSINSGEIIIDDNARRGGDLEETLRIEAANRRREREVLHVAASSSSSPATATDASVVKFVKHAPPPPAGVVRRKKTKVSSSTSSLKEGRMPLLTQEEEYALARTIQSGTRVHKLRSEYESTHHSDENNTPLSNTEWARLAGLTPNELTTLLSDYRSAKRELVGRNIGLVRAVVRSSYARKADYRGIPIEELIQEGSLGLIRAAELFDPERGLRFSTYATIWIKGVLSNTNSLDEVIALPSREKVIMNKVRRAWVDMSMEDGDKGVTSRLPNASAASELATRLDMDPKSVERHLRRMACVTNVLSLDYQYSTSTRSGHASGGRDETLRNRVEMGIDADLAEEAQLKADVVSGLVKNLTEKERTLMRLRYGFDDGIEYTLKECSERMGINKETARLLQHACLKKLREASNMESLQEYLLTVA
jgi:RNA polymerase primary sigma factor